MAFSGALQLTDLDDFLAPSQACILPVKQKNKVTKQEEGVNPDTEIRIDANNKYYEVAISSKPSTAAEPPTCKAAGSSSKLNGNANGTGNGKSVGVELDVVPSGMSVAGGVEGGLGGGTALEKAEISLNDCLACSGCVTSTESMLITLQSHLEVQTYINSRLPSSPERDTRSAVLTISPQTLSSLIASYSSHPQSSTTPPLNMQRLLRRIRAFFRREENGGWAEVWDTTFARHLSLMEHLKEYKERRAVGRTINSIPDEGGTTTLKGKGLPMLASACPGWVCYAEKAQGDLLGFVSGTRSSQGVVGGLVKQWWAEREGKKPNEIYHVTVMPCYDKKLEASRTDFYSELHQTRDVDCVLTTGELDLLLRERGFDPLRPVEGEDEEFVSERECPFPELLVHPGTSSGSYLHTLIDALVREAKNDTRLTTRPVRGSEDHVEYILEDVVTGEVIFKGAKCYGFRNLQNLVRKIGKETGLKNVGKAAGSGKLAAAVAARRRAGKAKLAAAASAESSAASSIAEQHDEKSLDYVEVMACPGGCVNGGGQMKPGAERPAAPAAVERDEEGFVRDWNAQGIEDAGSVKVDEGMRWSTKSWVAKVERIYWSGLPTPPPSPPASITDEAEGKIWQTRIVSADPKTANADAVARRIIVDVTKPAGGEYSEEMGEEAEERRREFLRTRYRKVESDISGLTAKW